MSSSQRKPARDRMQQPEPRSARDSTFPIARCVYVAGREESGVGVELSQFLDDELAPLLGFARLFIGDRATAEGIVHDVVVKLLAHPGRFVALEHPRAYVRRMVITEYASWGRKWFRVRPSAHLQYDLSDVGADDIVSVRDEIRRLLAGLPRNQRAVLVMRYYLQLGDTEIAETLGCSPGTVRTHASRGLSALRIESDSGPGAAVPTNKGEHR